jgi:hypothetical protein
MKRTHRSLVQRVGYLAIYACQECQAEETVPRFTYRLGSVCRCPRCGTSRLSQLKQRDKIDKMENSLWNLAARMLGGKLYHCCFCRIQFYDRRPLPEREPHVTATASTWQPARVK